MNTQITFAIRTISPDDARTLLARNTNNRPVSRRAVERYADDLRRGLWNYNGQDILLDENGNLLDGQHRLHGIILADRVAEVGVKTGIPADTFVTIDSGKSRTAADTLAGHGVANYASVAAAGRLVFLYDRGVALNTNTSRRQITDHAMECLPYLGDLVRQYPGNAGGINRSQLAAVLYLANRSRKYDTEVDGFIQGVSTGAGLELGDPRLALRNWVLHERDRGRGHLTSFVSFSAVARAWSAWAGHTSLKIIKTTKIPSRETTPIRGYVAPTRKG